jgi:hypothetical protein
MSSRILKLRDGRSLILGLLDEPLDYASGQQFVALLPAFSLAERQRVESLTSVLLDLGCRELCCVGPEAEELHDSLDELVEQRGATDLVTTWHRDHEDACEYFLHAASGGTLSLVALVSAHPDLEAVLTCQTIETRV